MTINEIAELAGYLGIGWALGYGVGYATELLEGCVVEVLPVQVVWIFALFMSFAFGVGVGYLP